MLYLPIGHYARKRARYEGRGARVARNHRPRNRPRRGPTLGPNGEVALESATGSLLPRRRAAAAAAAAAEAGSATEADDPRDDDEVSDGPDAEAGGLGGRGRGSRFVERQPLLHHSLGLGHGGKQHGGDVGAGGGGPADAAGVSSCDGDGGDGELSGGGKDGEGADVSTRQIVWAAIVVAPVWFGAQLAFTASLEFTSVTSNTVLSSCSSLFVYLGSLAMGHEVGSALRLGSVVGAMGGTTLVALGDRRSDAGGDGGGGGVGAGSNPLVGDALTLLAAALYAVYTLMMKRLLVKDDGAVMALFFGTIGVLYFAVLAPLAGVLALAGAAVVHRVTARALTLALLQGLIDYVAADYAWARAVMLLGPTATSCGLAMQIPAAGLIDAFINGNRLSWSDSPASLIQFMVGSSLIICGFIGVSLDPRVVAAGWRKVTDCFRRRRPGEAVTIDEAATAAVTADLHAPPWDINGATGSGVSGMTPQLVSPVTAGVPVAEHTRRRESAGGGGAGSAGSAGWQVAGSGPKAPTATGSSGRTFLRAMGLGGTGASANVTDMSYIPLRNATAVSAVLSLGGVDAGAGGSRAQLDGGKEQG